MSMMFDQIKEKFEEQIEIDFKLELLESHYYANSFGSGSLLYRIKGRNVKINYDGKEDQVELLILSKSNLDVWTTIQSTNPHYFIENVRSTFSSFLTS